MGTAPISRIMQMSAQAAGRILMSHFGTATVEYTKLHARDVVTKADGESNQAIASIIRANFPDHGIISEEASAIQPDAECVWIIDPLDGTRNFATRVPLFGVNIAFARNGVIESALIFLPAMDELFIAEAGKGAFCNERKMQCSQKSDWDSVYGIGATSAGAGAKMRLESSLAEISKDTAWMSSIASCAVAGAWAADGRRDFYYSKGSNVWDFAAPYLIAKESGCVVSDINGGEWSPARGKSNAGFIASAPALYPELQRMLKEAYFPG